jgi:membrane protein YdbS with pleckstrin-like domain
MGSQLTVDVEDEDKCGLGTLASQLELRRAAWEMNINVRTVLVHEVELLTWPLRQRWFWTIFFMLLLTLILPVLIVGLIFNFSSSALFVVLIVLIVVWIVVRSYRDWRFKKVADTEEVENSGSSEIIERAA